MKDKFDYVWGFAITMGIMFLVIIALLFYVKNLRDEIRIQDDIIYKLSTNED